MCRLLRIDILLFDWPWTRALKEGWITIEDRAVKGRVGPILHGPHQDFVHQ